MRPSVVLLGFVLGSAVAITFALFGVAVVFTWLQPEYPRLDSEMSTLWGTLGMFAVLTGVAAASFYGQLRARPWRRAAVAVLLLGIGAVGWFHWPR
jgi:threonine/homoserine/homoserine lactone efflux protein